jgi:AcrR family transcriptional regulator
MARAKPVPTRAQTADRVPAPASAVTPTSTATRRLGVQNSETRALLIKVAARLVRDEGCSAVTARRLAEEVGLKRQIVHYYFGTIEELLIAVIRTGVGKIHDRLKRALDSVEPDEPLRVIWETGSTVTATLFEFSALAIRREPIRVEIKRYMEQYREIQSKALARHLELRGIEPKIPPVVTAIVIDSIAHTLAVERVIGVTEGHAKVRAIVEEWLQSFAKTGQTSMAGPSL